MKTLHPSLKVKNIIVKENDSFRLSVKSWKCTAPEDLNSLEFVQESLKEDGTVADRSVYSFFMSDLELKKLAESIVHGN
jgi:hypothetical protein